MYENNISWDFKGFFKKLQQYGKSFESQMSKRYENIMNQICNENLIISGLYNATKEQGQLPQRNNDSLVERTKALGWLEGVCWTPVWILGNEPRKTQASPTNSHSTLLRNEKKQKRDKMMLQWWVSQKTGSSYAIRRQHLRHSKPYNSNSIERINEERERKIFSLLYPVLFPVYHQCCRLCEVDCKVTFVLSDVIPLYTIKILLSCKKLLVVCL